MAQYWEVYFADGRVVTSDDCAPADLPHGRVVIVLQPGAYERAGWQGQLLNINHLFYRSDLDCWTEHDESVVWALEEMKDHAHLIDCYRQGKWTGDWRAIRARADARYAELVNG